MYSDMVRSTLRNPKGNVFKRRIPHSPDRQVCGKWNLSLVGEEITTLCFLTKTEILYNWWTNYYKI